MVSIVTIARTELIRLFRDRSTLFFVFVFPLLLVVLIGASFGGGMETRIGVVGGDGGDAAQRIVQRLEDGDSIAVIHLADVDDLREQVSRNTLAAGVVLPDDLGSALERGEPAQVAFVSRPDTGAVTLRAVVQAAVADEAAVAGAAVMAAEHTGRPVAEVAPVVALIDAGAAGVEVLARAVAQDELAEEFAGLGQFDLGASSQLFLFTFLTALSAGAALIETRRLGVARRMASTATPIGSILGGQAAGRILVAVMQATYIIVATVLLFRVNWGDPLATGVIVLLFCTVSGGAGMLLGAAASNDSQAAGLGVGLGLAFAALGGSMAPLEIFPETMRTIAHVTPHAWANEAMAEIVRRGGGLADVTLQVAVLAGYAAVLLALATWQLRRALIR